MNDKPAPDPQDKPQDKPQAPIVLMGGMAFTLSEVLDAENNPEVMAKIEAWLAKKEKAFDQAQKRKSRPRPRRK